MLITRKIPYGPEGMPVGKNEEAVGEVVFRFRKPLVQDRAFLAELQDDEDLSSIPERIVCRLGHDFKGLPGVTPDHVDLTDSTGAEDLGKLVDLWMMLKASDLIQEVVQRSFGDRLGESNEQPTT